MSSTELPAAAPLQLGIEPLGGVGGTATAIPLMALPGAGRAFQRRARRA